MYLIHKFFANCQLHKFREEYQLCGGCSTWSLYYLKHAYCKHLMHAHGHTHTHSDKIVLKQKFTY